MNHGCLAFYLLEYYNVVIRYHTLPDSSCNSTSLLHPTTVDTAWCYLFTWALLMPLSRSLKLLLQNYFLSFNFQRINMCSNLHDIEAVSFNLFSPSVYIWSRSNSRCSQYSRQTIESYRYSFWVFENVQRLGIISMTPRAVTRFYAA